MDAEPTAIKSSKKITRSRKRVGQGYKVLDAATIGRNSATAFSYRGRKHSGFHCSHRFFQLSQVIPHSVKVGSFQKFAHEN